MKKLGIFLVVILVIIVLWVVDLLIDAGQFKAIENHFAGSCIPVTGLIGSEDLTIQQSTGIAFISSFDYRVFAQGDTVAGHIYRYDLNEKEPRLIDLPHTYPGNLIPHGISLYTPDSGQATLLVVNHSGGQNTIERFLVAEDRLIHQETYKDPLIISPNDVVAVDPDRFYFTNDHKYSAGLLRKLEDYGRLKLSNLVYYDGHNFSEAAGGYSNPNGVNVSADGKKLYMNAATELKMYVFDRDLTSGQLTRSHTIELGSGGDNIEIADNGDILVGAHPQLLKFVAHVADSAKLSPSQILRIRLNESGEYQVQEIYMNDGSELSGSSVGAIFNQRLLIGAVFDPRFLDCSM